MTRLFDRYLAMDYSGAGEDRSPQKGIAAWHCTAARSTVTARLRPGQVFSRETLTEALLEEIDRATERGARLLFGFDFQFSWPEWMWREARLAGPNWRTALKQLAKGADGRPPLDIPRRFCRAFNEYAGRDVFVCAIKSRAVQYGLKHRSTTEINRPEYRLAEKRLRSSGFDPKPAWAVGGQGPGMVGGQTVCGLRQIAALLDRPDIGWWPFDGLDASAAAYAGRHVGVEVYPAMFVPDFISKSDDNDARCTCAALGNADRLGWLVEWMNLGALSANNRLTVLKEGWILGVRP